MVSEQRRFIPIPDSDGGLHVPISIPVNPESYTQLVSLGRSDPAPRKRTPWDFVFSIGNDGEIFPFTRFGYTQPEERTDLRGVSPTLDRIAELCLETRGPGRFFVNPNGVFYKDRDNTLHQVAKISLQKREAVNH